MPTIENANSSLVAIKRHISDLAADGKSITPEMKRFLVSMATRCYELKGVKTASTAGHDFVVGYLSHSMVSVMS